MLQKRKMDKHFEKSGREMLKNVKGLTIFTKDNSDFLGNGRFGNV
jgi:hypothetical protein